MTETEAANEIADELRDRFPEIEKRKREAIAEVLARRLASALEGANDDYD